jgi:hypothetical protein
MHVINGREGNRTALFLVAHHCMADAEGMMEMLKVLFEVTPTAEGQPARVSSAGLVRQTHAQKPLHGLRALSSRDGRRRLSAMRQYMRTPAARLPFVRPVSGSVDIAWRQFPLQDVRAIAKTFGSTVTDVILAAFGAAIDVYASGVGADVNGKYLLLQVPANVRLPNKYGELGNELAMLPGIVPLGITDPVQRLRAIADYSRSLKELDMAAFLHGIMGTAFGIATPPGQAFLCRTMASRPYLNLARRIGLPPQEHALVSSIVLPPVTYSIDGQRITAFLNFVACQFNMGFVSSPVTYGDTVTITLSVDAENLRDADAVMNATANAIEVLGVLAAAPPK